MHIRCVQFNFYLYGFQKLLLGGDRRGGRENPQGCVQSETGHRLKTKCMRTTIALGMGMEVVRTEENEKGGQKRRRK